MSLVTVNSNSAPSPHSSIHALKDIDPIMCHPIRNVSHLLPIQHQEPLTTMSLLYNPPSPTHTDPFNPSTDVERKALATYTHISDNVYQNSRLGLADDAEDFRCSCLYRHERDAPSRACGDDVACINRLMYIECRPGACPVGKHCQNRRFQLKQNTPVSVFDAGRKGFGLRCEQDVPANTFIMEYVGDVIKRNRFLRRAKQYSAEGNKHFYFMALRSDQIIDAQKRGGLARFVNHSCRPNSCTQKWVVAGKLRIGLFTTRPVKKGDEITFDYKFERYGANAQECYCGEPCCTGFIGGSQNERAAVEIGTMMLQASAPESLLDPVAFIEEDDESSDSNGDTGRKQKRKRATKRAARMDLILDESSLRRLIGPWLLDSCTLTIQRLQRDIDRLLLLTDTALLKALVLVPKVGTAMLVMLKIAVACPQCRHYSNGAPSPERLNGCVDPLSVPASDNVPPWKVTSSPPSSSSRTTVLRSDHLQAEQLVPSPLQHPSMELEDDPWTLNETELAITEYDNQSNPRHSPTPCIDRITSPADLKHPHDDLEHQYSAEPAHLSASRAVLTFCKNLPITKRNTISKPGLLAFVQALAEHHPDDMVSHLAQSLVSVWMALEEVWEIPKLVIPSAVSATNPSTTTFPVNKTVPTLPIKETRPSSVIMTASPEPIRSSGAFDAPSIYSDSSPPPSTYKLLAHQQGYNRNRPSDGDDEKSCNYTAHTSTHRREPVSHGWRAYTLANSPIPDLQYYSHPVTGEVRWTLAPGMSSTHVSRLPIAPHIPPAPPTYPHPTYPSVHTYVNHGGVRPSSGDSAAVQDVVQQALLEAQKRVEYQTHMEKMAIQKERQFEKRRRVERFSSVRVVSSPVVGSPSGSMSVHTSPSVAESPVGVKQSVHESPSSRVHISTDHKPSKQQHPEWYRAAVKQLVVQQLRKYRPKANAASSDSTVRNGVPTPPITATSVSPVTPSSSLGHPLDTDHMFKQVAREISAEVLAKQRPNCTSSGQVLLPEIKDKVKEYIGAKMHVLLYRYNKKHCGSGSSSSRKRRSVEMA